MADIDGETRSLICSRLAEGESLRAICRTQGFPSAASVHGLVLKDKEFGEQYARARIVQGAGFGDEVNEELRADRDPADKRVRIDALKWLACKLYPKVYGDKVAATVEHSGSLTVITEERRKAVQSRVSAFMPGAS